MQPTIHDTIQLSRTGMQRRRFLRQSTALGLGTGFLGFREGLAAQADELRRQGKSLILLWMAGGPSQFETFDPKPLHQNGGGTKAISTAVPGIEIAEHWPRMAEVMQEVALIRSMTNREGNHQRATYQMHTGYIPSGSVKHPNIGSSIAQQIAPDDAELPSVVSIGPTEGAGFLGVDYEPFNVTVPGSLPANLGAQQPEARYQRRLGLMQKLEGEFAQRGAAQQVENHSRLYRKSSRLVLSPQTAAFDLASEPASLRGAYGNSNFGRACLLARRLVEAGVTFVELRSNGWDTHQENFTAVANKAGEVDPAAATLIRDLKERGLLDSTLVVWTGEFGRTPRVNGRNGRDHYPRAFSSWMAGGGVRGGQVIGSTSRDGSTINDQPVEVNDFLTSICHALGANPAHENISPLGRPMKVVDGGEIVRPLFG